LAADARDALATLARSAVQTPPPPPNTQDMVERRAGTPWVAFTAGVLTAALAFVIAALVR
jgi:hypothetical protein